MHASFFVPNGMRSDPASPFQQWLPTTLQRWERRRTKRRRCHPKYGRCSGPLAADPLMRRTTCITSRQSTGESIARHQQGARARVIHRDIKPENILLQGGHALVADFGIALAVQQAGGQRMTQTGLSLGTPQYMAPEQAMGEKAVDARADIYALGAVTYEMLAGEPPFTGPTPQAIVAKVMTSLPAPLSAARDTVPPHVNHAVLTALAKLPADRFTSASEFARALRATHASDGATTASLSATPPGTATTTGSIARRRAILLASESSACCRYSALWKSRTATAK